MLPQTVWVRIVVGSMGRCVANLQLKQAMTITIDHRLNQAFSYPATDIMFSRTDVKVWFGFMIRWKEALKTFSHYVP